MSRWPEEPVRPAGTDPDAALVVLLRVHFPGITYNIVASAGRALKYERGHLWHVSGVEGSCTWQQILDKALPPGGRGDRMEGVGLFLLDYHSRMFPRPVPMEPHQPPFGDTR